MVTTPDEVKESTTEDRAEEVARVIIGGHPQASIRRIALWVALFAGVALGFDLLVVVSAALLALTDQLL